MKGNSTTKNLTRIKVHLLLILIVVTVYDILLKPRKQAPAKVFKRGIEGFMLLRIKRLVIDDFDGVVTFYLQNGKTITVDLCNVLFVKGGVFVADAEYDRQA